jgi:MFS family permease
MQPGSRSGRFLGALALPTFALALGISVLTTYAPLLLGEATSSAGAIGIAVGAEGAFALFLPLLVGSLSDRTQSRFGRRIPYALVGVPLLVAPLAILPFAHGYAETVALVSLFFVGYHVYYPPYQALFAELVPASHQGRAQGWQGAMRGLGLGVALVAGGLLLSVWTPLPFLLAAGAAVLATVVLVREVRGPALEPASSPAVPSLPGPGVFTLLRGRSDVRAFVAANALWELSFMGLKTFIVLFVVKGLGESVGTASAVMGVVAAAYVIAAFGAGRLADTIGLHRLMRISIWVYGVGLLVGAMLGSLNSFLIGLPFIALAGAVVMTLPYGILVGITPAGAEGALSGLFGFSRALGAVLGPIVVGLAIDVLAPVFPSTNGYGAMWLAIGAPILLSLPFLAALRTEEPEPAVELDQPVTAAFDDLALAA